jgi:hypothetical protein
MCGRFARKFTQKVLADRLDVEFEDMPWFTPSYNVATAREQPPCARLNRTQ